MTNCFLLGGDEDDGRLVEEKLTDSQWVVVWSGDHKLPPEENQPEIYFWTYYPSPTNLEIQPLPKKYGGILQKISRDSLLRWELSQIENCQICPDFQMGK